ncbi:MAG: hypothetical protein J6A59_01805 [Lachnospiraceae bacterium]|nr:hypothetical protein [Lachnospiraceae bacterium]
MSRVDYEGKVFSKEKMLQRLEAEGRLDMIDDESRDIMSKIDGMPIEKNHFKALVYDELEFYVRDPKYGYIPVNINDCIEQ